MTKLVDLAGRDMEQHRDAILAGLEGEPDLAAVRAYNSEHNLVAVAAARGVYVHTLDPQPDEATVMGWVPWDEVAVSIGPISTGWVSSGVYSLHELPLRLGDVTATAVVQDPDGAERLNEFLRAALSHGARYGMTKSSSV